MLQKISLFSGIALFVFIIIGIMFFTREAVDANEEGVFIKKSYLCRE